MNARSFLINGVSILVNISWRPHRDGTLMAGEIIYQNVEKVDWVGDPSADDFLKMISKISVFEDQVKTESPPIWAMDGAYKIFSWVSSVSRLSGKRNNDE